MSTTSGPQRNDKTKVLEGLQEPVLGFNRVELIHHAVEQMEIRDLTVEDVLKTLREPDATIAQDMPGRTRVRRHKTFRYSVDVVYERLPDRIRVITAIRKERRLGRGRR